MEFPIAHVRSCKVDLAGDITLTFRLALNDENMAEAQELALLIGQDNDAGNLTFIPRQPPLIREFQITTKETPEGAEVTVSKPESQPEAE